MALRHNFHQIKQSLYTLLAKTLDGSLNEAGHYGSYFKVFFIVLSLE